VAHHVVIHRRDGSVGHQLACVHVTIMRANGETEHHIAPMTEQDAKGILSYDGLSVGKALEKVSKSTSDSAGILKLRTALNDVAARVEVRRTRHEQSKLRDATLAEHDLDSLTVKVQTGKA
jgi:hypothetical protein